jgi:hypothetical protein
MKKIERPDVQRAPGQIDSRGRARFNSQLCSPVPRCHPERNLAIGAVFLRAPRQRGPRDLLFLTLERFRKM